MKRITYLEHGLALYMLFTGRMAAIEYARQPADPQPTGWPLTATERAYVIEKAEHERRPGRELSEHLPALWPTVPTAGHWGGTSWLDTHAKLVAYVQANAGPADILLVGDSITQQWGGPLEKGAFNDAWSTHFANQKTINIGIGGDKTQNVLWRLDHGGVEGIRPRAIILMIGNNNMFFTPETGIAAAAQGVKACADNLREKFPNARLIVVKILPCHAPGNRFYEDIRLTNLEIEKLKLESDPSVLVMDLTKDFSTEDGRLRPALFKPDHVHLSPEGYKVYAQRLRPLLDAALSVK
jgi:platelet-activating factor acetylhydrolase IB subunit beta/gamma